MRYILEFCLKSEHWVCEGEISILNYSKAGELKVYSICNKGLRSSLVDGTRGLEGGNSLIKILIVIVFDYETEENFGWYFTKN